MFYAIAAMFFWGSSVVASKYIYGNIDPMFVIQIRLVIGSILIAPLFMRYVKRVPKAMWKQMAGLIFLSYPMVFFLQFVGAAHTSAASAVTIMGTQPLWMALINYLFFKQKLHMTDILLGLVALVGIIIIVSGEDNNGATLLGDLMVMLGAICWVYSNRAARDVMDKLTQSVYTSVSMVTGMMMNWPMLVFTQNWSPTFDHGTIAILLYLGVGCTWLATRWWNKGLSQVPPQLMSMIGTLEPVFGIMLAYMVLGEQLTPKLVIGIVTVLSATMLSVHFSLERRKLRRL
ncbi:EamA family transporter [Pasteurellaceae bacterium LIM206]|nr:EamA family transporter [Pasteurellaceae bacterium LIM206]